MALRLTIDPCQGKGAFINCPQGLSQRRNEAENRITPAILEQFSNYSLRQGPRGRDFSAPAHSLSVFLNESIIVAIDVHFDNKPLMLL